MSPSGGDGGRWAGDFSGLRLRPGRIIMKITRRLEGTAVKIFVVEDDVEIREMECYALNNSGFQTEAFENGADFFKALARELPGLVLLDIMLPGRDGLDILRELKSSGRTEHIPVILVTAKTTEMDTVRGLDLGADDYISKPFGIMELVSRVRARLRSAAHEETASSSIRYGDILMVDSKREVLVGGRQCELTFKEYELLKLFLTNPEIVLSRDVIMERVWGFDYEGNTRTVDVHIKTLRQKLGESGALIRTVRNVGYKLSGVEG